MRVAAVASLTLLLLASSARAQGILVRAPDETTEGWVGLYFDADFALMRGQRANVVASRSQPRIRMVRTETRRMSSQELQANATIAGVGAGFETRSRQTYGYVRAIRYDRVMHIPPSVELPTPSSGAAYMVTRVSYGWMYEVRVRGRADAVSMRVNTLIGGPGGRAGGGVSATTSETETHASIVGLHPTGSEVEAMTSLRSEADIARTFEHRGQAVPLFVELSPVQGGAREGRFQLSLVRVTFPERNLMRRNAAWDIMRGRPDPRVVFVQNGRSFDHISASNTLEIAPRPPQSIGTLTVSANSPLILQFEDVDPAQSDPAGSVRITELHTGENEFRSPQSGVTVVLRASPAN